MSIKGIYDIHCHIVPGVDDGATDIGETVKLLRMEYEQGVRTVIATPHFRFRMFETPAEKVREQFRLVEKAASEISPDLHVYLGPDFKETRKILMENLSGHAAFRTDEEAQKFLAREKAKRDALKAAKQAAQNGNPATGETAAQDAAQPTQPDCGADTAQMLEAGA